MDVAYWKCDRCPIAFSGRAVSDPGFPAEVEAHKV